MDDPTLESLIAENQRLRSELEAERGRAELLKKSLINFSPELRALIETIRTQCFLIEKRGTDKLPRYAASIAESVNFLENLVFNLSLLLQLQDGLQKPTLPIQLNDVLLGLKPRVEALQNEFHIQSILVFELQDALPSVSGDSELLGEAFYQLFKNAHQHTPPDTVITIRTYLGVGEVVAEVRDSGVGIQEQDLPHIFEIYFTAKYWREEVTGFGVGLTIVKAVVEAHHGRIEVESTWGQGSVFRVILPAAT